MERALLRELMAEIVVKSEPIFFAPAPFVGRPYSSTIRWL
jgi:hypothetical protein